MKASVLSVLAVVSLIMFSCSGQMENSKVTEMEGLTGGLNVAGDSAGMVSLSIATDNPYYLQEGGEEYVYFLAKLKAGYYEPDEERAPLNISMVIDRSGSMGGSDRLDYVKKAAEALIKNLGEHDLLSVVSYDTRVDVNYPSATVKNKDRLIQTVNSLRPGGSTDLGGGLLRGLLEAKGSYNNEYVNRVLLLSDGLANQGETDPFKLQKLAQRYYNDDGVSLSTFGVGNDFNEDLMTGLAESGNGNYYFIDSPEKIEGIFEREMNGLLSVVAQDVVLEVEFPEGNFEVVGVDGYQYDVSDGVLRVDFNNLVSEEEKLLLIKFKPSELTNPSYQFNAKLSYTQSLDDNAKGNLTASCVIEQVADSANYAASRNDEVYSNVVIYESNTLYEEAIRYVDQGDYKKAEKYLSDNNIYLEGNMHYVKKDERLQGNLKLNGDYLNDVKDYENKTHQEQKYIQKYNKGEAYRTKKRK